MLPPRTLTRLAASFATLALGLASVGCATTHGLARPASPEVGMASYYAHEHHGLRTASGERFDMNELTAAHRTLPFGTRVRVTNLGNGHSVVARINDRGPWKKGRIVDLSYAAARKVGLIGPGTARVRLEVLAIHDP